MSHARLLEFGLVSAVVMVGLACASPIRTSHDFDPNVDASRFSSFAWIKDGPGQFEMAHSITVDKKGTIYVSEGDGQRIQVFSLKK